MKNSLLLIILSSFNLFSQQVTNPEWRNYLNSETVQAIAEEGDYLWIGSQAGMTRLNKTTCEKEFYNKGNTILPTNIIFDIKIDLYGYKWVATFKGLIKFKDDEWILFNTWNSGLPHDEVRVIEIDSIGNIWVGTSGGGIGKFNGVTWEVLNNINSPLPSNVINDLEFETSDMIWIGTSLGLVKKESDNWTVFDTSNSGLTANNISVIKIDKFKNKWIGASGVIKFDNNNWANFLPTRNDRIYGSVYSISIDDKNNKWVAANNYGPDYGGGIFLIDSLDVTIEPVSSLPLGWVNTIFIDKQNIKWFGGLNGFMKFSQVPEWIELSNSKLLHNKIIGLQINKQTNQKYFYSYSDIPLSGEYFETGFLTTLYDTSWALFHGANSPLFLGVFRLTSTNTGDVYVARYSGNVGDSLFLYKNGSWQSVSTPFRDINYLYWDGEKLWVYFHWNGLYQFFNGNWTEITGFPGVEINQMIRQGKTWWFGCINGLVRYQDSTWTRYTTTNSSLPHEYINSLTYDNHGNLWIGTYNGLANFDGTNWVLYNSENSPLFDDNVTALACDSFGKVFIGTSVGLFKKDKNEWKLFDSHNSGLPNGYYTVYGYFIEEQRIRALAVDTSNNIWIATSGGIGVYDEDGLPLPVELLSFSASVENNSAILTWSTSSEVNNRGFEIQRKTILSDWRSIGFISGVGTASHPQYYSYQDNISEGVSGKISYRLKQIDFDGSFKYSEIIEIELTPTKFSLEQNYPNPFNPSTKIRYAIPLLGGDERGGLVTLRVHDILGNEVVTLVNEYKPAGKYEVEFDAEKLSSGVYFYTLSIDEYLASQKMILLK